MIQVWKIRPEVNRYPWVSTQPGELDGEDLVFDGGSRAGRWRPLHAKLVPPERTAGDFHKLGHGALVLAPRAFELTRHLVERCGELLPVHMIHAEHAEHWLLNVTRVADCLDPEATRWKELGGKKVHVLEYAFLPEALPPVSVFKVAGLERARRLSLTGRVAAAHEFKTLVEGAGLRGLVFEEVWAEA